MTCQRKRQKVTDCFVGDILSDLTNGEMEFDEYSEYLREMVRVPDPLAWWKLSESRYPHSALLAMQYLSIPATLVPSEQVILVAGLTVSNLRASLDRETVNEIIFLHKHLKGTITDLLKQFPNNVAQA